MDRGPRRIRHGKWFIQSSFGKTMWVAWATLVPTKSPLDLCDHMYFQIAATEQEAIDVLVKELNELEGSKNV